MIQKFVSILGKENVYTTDEDLDLYRDAYSIFWGEPEERIASAALTPANVEQVQAVVRIANQYRIPLYPCSTGRNLGYGGSAPAYSGKYVVRHGQKSMPFSRKSEISDSDVDAVVAYFQE